MKNVLDTLPKPEKPSYMGEALKGLKVELGLGVNQQ